MREITPSDIQKYESKGWVVKHRIFIIFLLSFYLFAFYMILEKPKGWDLSSLKSTFHLFAPSIVSFILLLYIGIYLVYRYHINPITKSESFYQLSWGLSFIGYSISFLGLSLQAFSIGIADMSKPEIFFIWGIPMILWASGMWVGTALLFSQRSKLIHSSGMGINLFGFLWFIYGLILKEDISLTMYVFLYLLFIPLCLTISYFWFKYAQESKLNSPYLLSLGFLLMGISYAGWAPWHFQEVIHVYFIFYQIFVLSLSFIFAGFYGLPKESSAKFNR